jgi:PAS domain-containing protein
MYCWPSRNTSYPEVPGVLFQLRRDADGGIRINYLSNGSEEISGIPSEELRRDFGIFLRAVHDEDRPLIAEALERSISEMKVKEHTVRLNHRDGSVHWIKNIVASPSASCLMRFAMAAASSVPSVPMSSTSSRTSMSCSSSSPCSIS